MEGYLSLCNHRMDAFCVYGAYSKYSCGQWIQELQDTCHRMDAFMFLSNVQSTAVDNVHYSYTTLVTLSSQDGYYLCFCPIHKLQLWIVYTRYTGYLSPCHLGWMLFVFLSHMQTTAVDSVYQSNMIFVTLSSQDGCFLCFCRTYKVQLWTVYTKVI